MEKLYHCFGCGAGGDVFSFVMETEGLDFGGRAGVARRPRRRRARARERGPARRRAARAARPAAGAAGAHGRLLRARAVGERARPRRAREYLLGARAGGGRAARVPRRLLAVALGPGADGLARGGLHRGGAAGGRAGVALARRRAAVRPLPRADHVPAGRRARARARLRRARAGARASSRSTSTRATARSSTRAGSSTAPTSRARRPRKAGRVVLVEGYTDVIALRQAGVPEAVCSMGTALTDPAGRRAGAAGAARAVLPGPRRGGPEGGRPRRWRRSPSTTRPPDGHEGGLPDRAAAGGPGPGRRRPAPRAPTRCGGCSTPRCRCRATQVERALEGDLTGTDGARRGRSASPRRRSRRSAPSVLRDELVKLVSDRLNVPATSSRA